MPAYPGMPVRESDAEHTYAFEGWTPEVVRMYSDASYTAVYSESAREHDLADVPDGIIVTVDGRPVASIGTVADDGSYTVQGPVEFSIADDDAGDSGYSDDGGFPWRVVVAIVLICGGGFGYWRYRS